LLAKAAGTLVRRYPQHDRLMGSAALCALASGDQAVARQILPHLGEYWAESRIWLDQHSYQGFVAWSRGSDDPTGWRQRVWGGHLPTGIVCFAPNTRYVWCGLLTGTEAAYLLDTEKGRPRSALAGVRGATIDALSIDDERKWAVGAVHGNGPEQLALWNLNRPEFPAVVPISERCILTTPHPKSMRVAWAADQRVHLLDLETSAEGPVLEIGQSVRGLGYSTTGKWLAVNHGATSLFDVATGERKVTLPSLTQQPPPPLACHKPLAVDDDGRVLALATAEGKPNRKLCFARFAADGKTGEVLIPDLQAQGTILEKSLRLSKDCTRLAAALPATAGTGKIRVWDITNARHLLDLPGHWCEVAELRFSADGKLLASMGMWGGDIKIWSLDQSQPAAAKPATN
jgi:WD40 repeat protein